MVIMITFPSIFSTAPTLTYSFNESDIRTYLPICTNNLTCDKLYARIVESDNEIAYEFLLYWDNQSGVYKFSEHEFDWEFIVVYTYLNGTVNMVAYDTWHYYIGRSTTFSAYNDTNVLMLVDPAFHSFKPDIGIRSGNVSWQINNQTVYELTPAILSIAQTQVGFDPELYRDPFAWKEMGWFGRYTAFDDWYKAIMVVSDKKFSFIDFEQHDTIFGTEWL